MQVLELGTVNPVALVIMTAALVMTFVLKRPILRLLGICALLRHRHGAPARVAAKSATVVIAPGPTRRGRTARSGLLRFALGGALAAAQW